MLRSPRGAYGSLFGSLAERLFALIGEPFPPLRIGRGDAKGIFEGLPGREVPPPAPGALQFVQMR